jgi:hypothetical protein
MGKCAALQGQGQEELDCFPSVGKLQPNFALFFQDSQEAAMSESLKFKFQSSKGENCCTNICY